MPILRIRDADGNVTAIPAIRGEKGDPGAPGKTPVVGVDYFTEADKQEMVTAVLAALPSAEGGSF